jgi:hypothetical protein
VIKELKTLTALRSRIINASKQLKTALQEGEQFFDKALQKKMHRIAEATMLSAFPEGIRSGSG